MHWCPEHLSQSARNTHRKKMHIYIYTYTHMHTHTYTHEHACASMTLPNTLTHRYWDSQSIPKHTYTYIYTCMYIHAYVYTLIHIHIQIYTCIHVRTHTYIHICTHTHTTCTYARTQARLERQRSSDCARSLTWRQEAPPFSLSAAIRRGVTLRGQQPNCPTHKEQRIGAQQPQPTEAHHTITTARLQDCTRSSVLVRNQSIIAPAAGHGDDALK